jgi:hypothetical protein
MRRGTCAIGGVRATVLPASVKVSSSSTGGIDDARQPVEDLVGVVHTMRVSSSDQILLPPPQIEEPKQQWPSRT